MRFHVIFQLIVSLALTAAKKDANEDIHASFGEDPNDQANKKMFKNKLEERANFTSCPEFLNNTKLDINKILEVEWQIFYYYTDSKLILNVPHVFVFRSTDPTLVNRFESEMNLTYPHQMHMFNWTAAEMFLDTNVDFSGVLLATNVSGFYDVIASAMIEGDLRNENYHIGLKFLEPHFLGFMTCEFKQLLVLAPVDKMPKEDEEEKMAKLFNFRSDLGMSLADITKILKEAESPTKRVLHEHDDRDMNLIYEEEDHHETMSMI